MNKDIVLIDFDGTLFNTGEGVFFSFRYAWEKLGVPDRSDEDMRIFIGPPLEYSFKNYCGLSDEDVVRAVDYYRESYIAEGIFKYYRYDGVVDMLKQLKQAGKIICTATSKPEQHVHRILERDGEVKNYIDHVFGATFDKSRSEKAQVIAYAKEQLAVTDTSNVIMIGDTKNDVLGAKDQGIETIGVLYGYGTEKELVDSGAVAMCKTPQDVVNTILG